MGRHAPPDDPAAERVDRGEERIPRVGARRRPRSGSTSAVSGPAREPRERDLDGVGVVVDVVDRDDLDRGPRPWPGRCLEPLRRAARTDSLTTTPTRTRRNGATRTIGWLPNAAIRAPGSTTDAVDDVRRHLDARDEVAALDDLAVEDREHLERVEPVEPLELGDANVDDARRRGDEVDPALVRAAASRPGPATAVASRSAASSSWSSPASGTRTVTGGAGSAGGERAQVVGRSAADPSPSARRRRSGHGRGPLPTSFAGARRPGTTRSTRTPVPPPDCAVRRAAERRLDRAARVDLRHRGPVLAVGVDVAVDGHARRSRGRQPRRSPRPCPSLPTSAASTALARYGDLADPGQRDPALRDRARRPRGRPRPRRRSSSPDAGCSSVCVRDRRRRRPGRAATHRTRISSGAMPVWNAPWKKPSAATDALAALRADDDRAVEREHERRQVRRGVGVGDRAADRARGCGPGRRRCPGMRVAEQAVAAGRRLGSSA